MLTEVCKLLHNSFENCSLQKHQWYFNFNSSELCEVPIQSHRILPQSHLSITSKLSFYRFVLMAFPMFPELDFNCTNVQKQSTLSRLFIVTVTQGEMHHWDFQEFGCQSVINNSAILNCLIFYFLHRFLSLSYLHSLLSKASKVVCQFHLLLQTVVGLQL